MALLGVLLTAMLIFGRSACQLVSVQDIINSCCNIRLTLIVQDVGMETVHFELISHSTGSSANVGVLFLPTSTIPDVILNSAFSNVDIEVPASISSAISPFTVTIIVPHEKRFCTSTFVAVDTSNQELARLPQICNLPCNDTECPGTCSTSCYGFCDEIDRLIILNKDKVDDLAAGIEDHLAISRQQIYNTDSLDSECVTSVERRTFNATLEDCDPYIEMNNDSVTYTWTIRKVPDINETRPIQRFIDSCFNISCVFDRSETVESSGIDSEIEKNILQTEEASGEFELDLTVYEDEDYFIPLGSGEVLVPNYIYAKVDLVNEDVSDTSLYVQIESCKATPTPAAGSASYYSIIESGCAADNTGDPSDAINVTRNYDLQSGTFQFRSFVWTSDFDQLIYIHCEVIVCDSSAPGATCDALTCSKRKRRDIENTDSRQLVYGPVRVSSPSSKNPALTCAQNNGGCSDTCLLQDDGVICACPEGKELMRDGKTCFARDAAVETNKYGRYLTNFDTTYGTNSILMIVAVILVCVSLIISCGAWWMRRGGSKSALEI